MFSLKKFLVSECDFKLVCFCELQGIRDILYVSVFAEKSLNRLVLVWLLFTLFLITMHKTDATT